NSPAPSSGTRSALRDRISMRFLPLRSSPRVTMAVWTGLAHLAIGMTLLAVAFPHEDALILFKFAKNVAHGDGVVFFRGGPPAEGATDFLWMMMLAAGQAVGVDVAIAAAILNAIACGVGAWIMLHGPSPRWRVVDRLACIALLASPAAA